VEATMLETADELVSLQELFDASLGRSGEHLRGIIHPGSRTPSAEVVVRLLRGMKVLVVATVGADGRPRTSAVDGHFVHGRWLFTTSGDAMKCRDLQNNPAVSVSYVDGERFAIFTHGDAEFLEREHPAFDEIEAHLTAHYGSSPSSWGPSIVYIRVQPRWSVPYAFDLAALG
jgi:general stress protein 26